MALGVYGKTGFDVISKLLQRRGESCEYLGVQFFFMRKCYIQLLFRNTVSMVSPVAPAGLGNPRESPVPTDPITAHTSTLFYGCRDTAFFKENRNDMKNSALLSTAVSKYVQTLTRARRD